MKKFVSYDHFKLMKIDNENDLIDKLKIHKKIFFIYPLEISLSSEKAKKSNLQLFFYDQNFLINYALQAFIELSVIFLLLTVT